jgi:hypothetical protein
MAVRRRCTGFRGDASCDWNDWSEVLYIAVQSRVRSSMRRGCEVKPNKSLYKGRISQVSEPYSLFPPMELIAYGLPSNVFRSFRSLVTVITVSNTKAILDYVIETHITPAIVQP